MPVGANLKLRRGVQKSVLGTVPRAELGPEDASGAATHFKLLYISSYFESGSMLTDM